MNDRPKTRIGMRKAKQELDSAIIAIENALHCASFALDYLGEERKPSDRPFYDALKVAETALRQAYRESRE